MDDRFRVTLNFSNQPETLVVPFEAVKTFIDPSAKFGLKFDDHESDEMVLDLEDIEAIENDETPDDEPPEGSPDGPSDGKPRSTADVVNLDRFRKS
jgi:hypothetical protein